MMFLILGACFMKMIAAKIPTGIAVSGKTNTPTNAAATVPSI